MTFADYIPPDKQKHFAVGFGIAATVMVIALVVAPHVNRPLGLAFAAVLIAAAGKEVWDKFHPENHQAEWWDIVATLAGWVPVALIHQAISFLTAYQ